jgi:hypothetical protein
MGKVPLIPVTKGWIELGGIDEDLRGDSYQRVRGSISSWRGRRGVQRRVNGAVCRQVFLENDLCETETRS